MQIHIENFGPIKDASIDLSKDLLLFTGQNNTGKTYLSYLIFGIAKMSWFSGSKTTVLRKQIEKVFESGSIEIDVEKTLTTNYENLLEIMNDKIKEFIPRIFNSKKNFDGSSVKITWGSSQDYKVWAKALNFNMQFGFGSTNVKISKNAKTFILNVSLNTRTREKELSPDFPKDFILNILQQDTLQRLFEFLPSSTQFLPAERIGVAIFARDISNNKVKAFDEILTNSGVDRAKFIGTLSKQFNQYPLPIQDAISQQETKNNFKNNVSDFSDLALEIEDKILRGKIELNTEGDIELVINNDQRLSLSLSGSSVKSLSALTYFLQHQARRGSLLIFDEPEINLHPDNQIVLARVLAKIANRGIKVIMSTHSDYMIREFSNLLMLSSSNSITNELKNRHGYSDAEILNPSNIVAYFLSKNESGSTDISKIELHANEIIVKSINDTINKQNTISQDIYFSLNSTES